MQKYYVLYSDCFEYGSYIDELENKDMEFKYIVGWSKTLPIILTYIKQRGGDKSERNFNIFEYHAEDNEDFFIKFTTNVNNELVKEDLRCLISDFEFMSAKNNDNTLFIITTRNEMYEFKCEIFDQLMYNIEKVLLCCYVFYLMSDKYLKNKERYTFAINKFITYTQSIIYKVNHEGSYSEVLDIDYSYYFEFEDDIDVISLCVYEGLVGLDPYECILN